MKNALIYQGRNSGKYYSSYPDSKDKEAVVFADEPVKLIYRKQIPDSVFNMLYFLVEGTVKDCNEFKIEARDKISSLDRLIRWIIASYQN